MMNGSQKSLSLRLRSGQAPKSQRAIFFRMGHPLGGVFFEDRVNSVLGRGLRPWDGRRRPSLHWGVPYRVWSTIPTTWGVGWFV
jgi:hypothetical protein